MALDTATASPAPDPPQATPESLPEVTVSNTRLPAQPDEQTVQPLPLTDISDPLQGGSPYVKALANVDDPGGLARVQQAIEQSPEEQRAQEYDKQVAAHWQKQSEWEDKMATMQEQWAQWMQKAQPEMVNYLQNTPSRQAIYAANMHVAPMLAILSTIGGKLTRASGLQMLAATTGAVQGLNAGNEQAYQDQMTKYKAGLDAFQEQVKMQNDYYNMMLKSYAGRADAEEKAAAAAERMSGNLRTEEQKKLATAVQALRADVYGTGTLGRLQVAQEGNEIKRQMYGLQFTQGQSLGAQGLDHPISQYAPMQVLGILAASSVPLSGSRFTLAQEIQGIQKTAPNLTLRQLIGTMRENKLNMTEAVTAMRTMTTRTAPTAQAYAALAGPNGIFARLKASAAEVNFNSSQVQNEIRAWSAKKWSADPKIQRYMTDLEDARTELAVILSRGGRMSDVARGWATEALPEITSQRALNAAIDESTAIGQRVLQGDVRAMRLIASGGKLEDIFQQTAGPPPPGAPKEKPPDVPEAGHTQYDHAGHAWIAMPNGYMQRADGPQAGEIVAPEIGSDGKPTGKWRRVSGPAGVPSGQGVGGANASMAYANEGGWGAWGEYGDPRNQYPGGGGGMGGGGFGGGPYPRGPNVSWSVASDYIKRYESRGANVMNYMYPQDPQRRTASGPWQITASNFHEYGRRLGIDTSQWQYAMDAPEQIQERIAQAMFEDQGFAPWAPYNPALARAIRYGYS